LAAKANLSCAARTFHGRSACVLVESTCGTRILYVFNWKRVARTRWGISGYSGFARIHQITNGPSKSTARNTPYCFTRRWADSVMR
jgi:hypothetical protein